MHGYMVHQMHLNLEAAVNDQKTPLSKPLRQLKEEMRERKTRRETF